MNLNPRANTVDGVLRRSAAKYPDRVAVIFEDRTLCACVLLHSEQVGLGVALPQSTFDVAEVASSICAVDYSMIVRE
ncbi:hypothetical protein EEB13_30555 [Rhodococcus sp. WS3]|uniref:hypothetical protein n=1 Tax=unclassified Rhodococcus (in: high G+C Gram-positive bacteria) TaxID=192944 RepID=UPI0006971C88|nr:MULTISPECIES: hypothetical protein [unclassified Rhodococcus (in: high G+C Gram-positive bacteria)]ROZ42785.1 hypothetical protein EEB13_30555 [Rhodococcus sp. WS3]RZL20963.1 MAG: hypothetical protein EOP31_30165 [Rhodococcus sp. (in: high G+C Gram-positive bacteria)]